MPQRFWHPRWGFTELMRWDEYLVEQMLMIDLDAPDDDNEASDDDDEGHTSGL